MARSLNITVGGEQARIRCSIAGDVLSIMASKCFAAYIRLMKLATEGKYEMPVPDGSDRPRPPLELGAPMQPPLCMKDMGAFNADMAIRFPEDADKYIKAFLAGDDVAKTFDSVPPAPGTAKMFTLEEVQDLITKGVTAGLEAAGVVTKPEPVAELATEPVDTEPDVSYDMTGLSEIQIQFADNMISGMTPEQSVERMTYSTASARKAALTRFKKVPALARIIEGMENPVK